MKRALIIGVIMFCVQQMNAQTTPCEKMFSKAKNYYEAKDYTNAKAQFQKVVNNCDSNKELAQEYIVLCNEWIRMKEEERLAKEQGKSELDANARRIKELQDRVGSLQAENAEYAGTFENSRKIIVEQDSVIAAKSDSIRMEKKMNAALYSSLREKGGELNGYLNAKLSKSNRKKIQPLDKIVDDSLMIVFGKNLKLVNEIKAL